MHIQSTADGQHQARRGRSRRWPHWGDPVGCGWAAQAGGTRALGGRRSPRPELAESDRVGLLLRVARGGNPCSGHTTLIRHGDLLHTEFVLLSTSFLAHNLSIEFIKSRTTNLQGRGMGVFGMKFSKFATLVAMN